MFNKVITKPSKSAGTAALHIREFFYGPFRHKNSTSMSKKIIAAQRK